MEKTLFLKLVFALALCSVVCACSDKEPCLTENNQETSLIEEFLSSKYGISTLQNQGLTIANLNLKNLRSDLLKAGRVKALIVPIVENGVVTGRLNAFIVLGDGSYRAVVEKWNKVNEREYNVVMTTGLGAYMATVEVTRYEGKTTQKITDVASANDAMLLRTKGKRKEGEGWWACTTRVYAAAKEACSGDGGCDFLCDLVDLGGGCTISMAAAAAIVCI